MRSASARKRGRDGVIVSTGTPRYTGTKSRTGTGTRARTGTGTAGGDRDLYIVAAIENNAKEVGLCAYNLHGFDVELRQFADSNTLSAAITSLCLYAPIEVVISASSADGILDNAISACPYLSEVKKVFIGRNYFNETLGGLAVDSLSSESCSNLANLGDSSCYLALAACGALMKYVQHIQELSFEPGTLRIRFQPNEGCLFLDVSSIECLELVRNARAAAHIGGPREKDCLLTIMDKTKTRAGKRFLRRSLLQPTADLVTITMRQDVVEELSSSETAYFGLVSSLNEFPDIERSISALMTRENARLRNLQKALSPEGRDDLDNGDRSDSETAADGIPPRLQKNILESPVPPSMALIRNVLNIKAAMDAIQFILEALDGTCSSLLQAIAESLRSAALGDLQREIGEVLESSAVPAKEIEHMRLQGAFAVKTGRNGQLDVSRKTLSENVEDMHDMCEKLREKFGLPRLSLAMHATRGFHFTIPAKVLDTQDFPDEFIQIQKGKKVHRFSTVKLGELNSRYQESLLEIWGLTELELGSLLDEIFDKRVLASLHRLCDGIAILDCCSSFVTYASLSPVTLIKPNMTDGGPLALKQAHHPILVARRPLEAIPNDLFMDETSALHIISGRNEAGKSTFLKGIGLLCIMAHTGCSVPAKFASIRALRRILTRFNTSDDITLSESHFSKEMKDVAGILAAVRENESLANDMLSKDPSQTLMMDHECGPVDKKDTLVLMDELGRATTTLDGFSIAYAVAERLAATPRVLTLFATHFLGLAAMARINPAVRDFHLATELFSRDGFAVQAVGGNPQAPGTTEPSDAADSIPPLPDASLSTPSDSEQVKMHHFTYTVKAGVLRETRYGIDTARAAGFSEDVIKDALIVRERLPVRRISLPDEFAQVHLGLGTDGRSSDKRLASARAAFAIVERISMLRSATSDPATLRRMMRDLQATVRATSKSDQQMRTLLYTRSTIQPAESANATAAETDDC